MQEKYSLKVQAIRSKKQRHRLYVYMPAALAEAIGLEPGEEVVGTAGPRRAAPRPQARPEAPRQAARRWFTTIGVFQQNRLLRLDPFAPSSKLQPIPAGHLHRAARYQPEVLCTLTPQACSS